MGCLCGSMVWEWAGIGSGGQGFGNGWHAQPSLGHLCTIDGILNPPDFDPGTAGAFYTTCCTCTIGPCECCGSSSTTTGTTGTTGSITATAETGCDVEVCEYQFIVGTGWVPFDDRCTTGCGCNSQPGADGTPNEIRNVGCAAT
jgi:hypothetical protein